MKSYPEYFFIELTKNCNLYCTMCRPHVMQDESWSMPDQLLEKAAYLVEKYAKVVDLRGWGESTLDDRLIPLALRFQRKCIQTRLYTNMNARNNQFWTDLAGTGIIMAVSIESGIEENYSKLRRGGDLTQVKSHIEAIVTESKNNSDVRLPYFTVVISENNLDDLSFLVDLAFSLGLREIEINPISCADSSCPSGRRTGLRRKDFEKAVDKLSEMDLLARDRNIDVTVAANLFSENTAPQNTCIHPWKYCCICTDGNVTFCDHLLHHGRAIMGNLNEQSFDEIWFGPAYEKLRKSHMHTDFTDFTKKGIECEWCYRNRYGNSEWMVEPGIRPIHLHEYLLKL